MMAVRPANVICLSTFNHNDLLASDKSQELKGLEALEFQMVRNYEVLKERRENDIFSGTFKGIIFNWGGRLFAIYCVFRVISVSGIIFQTQAILNLLWFSP
jgi:hypothetical protein